MKQERESRDKEIDHQEADRNTEGIQSHHHFHRNHHNKWIHQQWTFTTYKNQVIVFVISSNWINDSELIQDMPRDCRIWYSSAKPQLHHGQTKMIYLFMLLLWFILHFYLYYNILLYLVVQGTKKYI